MAVIESEADGRGKLVALEGDIATISTQLRLLPPSQKILVLPSLMEGLAQLPELDIFDARTFVRDVHNIFTKRTETARSFLRSSISTQPRLVFMNGGSVGARTTCISRISESVTGGDIEEAEAIFNEIVQDGVAGVMRHAAEAAAEDEMRERSEETEDRASEKGEGKDVDPIIKAMNAADSLDRETALLESEELACDTPRLKDHGEDEGDEAADDQGVEEDLVIQKNNSNEGDELKAHTQQQKPRTQETIFIAPHGEEIRQTVVTVPSKTNLKESRNAFGPHHLLVKPSTTSKIVKAIPPVDDTDDEADFDFGVLSPSSATLVSIPTTPGVEYGEACIVDMYSAKPHNPVRKTQSVDRFFPSLFRDQDLPSSPKTLNHTASAYHLRSRPKTSSGLSPRDAETFQTLPRTTFVRALQTTIKRSPTALESVRSSTSSTVTEPPRIFVDRGTDPVEVLVEEPATEEQVEIFEPVFPIVEDLIISFTARGSNEIFDSVIWSYKNGSYPAFSKSEPTEEVETGTEEALPSPVSSMTTEDRQPSPLRPRSHLTAETDDVGYTKRHNYDPYAEESYPPDIKRQWPPKDTLGRAESTVPSLEPPTPSITPPPSNHIAEKFLDFAPVNTGNAISVQNSLRQFLSAQFPTSDGYTQHIYAAGADTDRLWKPVFRNDESAIIGDEERTVDQIVALGCEDGVKKDFFAHVSGQIERLGTKKDGFSRSGKLDIRYLISNVMQRFSDVPLTTESNPLSNPDLLATLLVPQIEAFLAINITTRFLILQYTSDHLATILALRKLLGTELLKVAGILDTLSSDPPSFTSRPRTPTKINPLSNQATSSPRSNVRLNSLQSLQRQTSTETSLKTKKSEIGVSFSKANYLLPSTATDAEITTFLSGIWKTLMEKSAFYTPEPEPKLIRIERPPPQPKTPTISSHPRDRDRDSGYPPSSFRAPRNDRESKISRLTGISNPQGHRYAPSIASTTRTTASERGRREDREWENFYIAEEDSEDDAYDRMILGRGFAKIVPEVRKAGQKRNTKKALKWLGLA